MSDPRDVVIIDGARTPFAKSGTKLKNVHAAELGRVATKDTIARANLDPNIVDEVIVGNAGNPSDAVNIARIIALNSGLPQSISAFTVHRNCASAMEAVSSAYERIKSGTLDVILAGGTESMSQMPLMFSQKFADLFGEFLGAKTLPKKLKVLSKLKLNYLTPRISIMEGLRDPFSGMMMGDTAEILAKEFGISRKDQDEFALESHLRALTAIKEGWFNNEICPITVTHRHPNLHSSEVKITRQKITTDEGPRKDTSLKKLLALPPVFAREGSVSAGNSSQISDGAAMAVVASGAAVKKYGLKPLARFCGFSVAGVDPKIMGVGPVYAVPKVLKQTGIHLKDIGWIELNEAFAVQALTVMHQLKLDPQIVNPVGGAIALGHPLGATGAILTAKCLYGLQRTRQKYGLVTMCIGTGMGAAALFQAY